MNRGLLAWLAIVVPVWSVLVFCTYWEPIMRDGWRHHGWHMANDLSLRGLWEFFETGYLRNNPRLGQTFTLIQHTPGVHPILTPLLELALFYLLAVLVVGRRLSLHRVDDALLFATIIAMVFVCGRSLGPMLFYRPFTGNYVFGLVANVAWLLPYRLHAEEPRRWRWWWSPIMLVLGVAAGLCNEHTGPAFIAAGGFAAVRYWRRGERVVPWAWCGVLGLVAGAALLVFAPGQEVRYAGLATQQSTLDLFLERGVGGNARIVLLYALYCSPLLIGIGLGVAGRRRNARPAQRRARAAAQLALLAIAGLIVLTLLASPKQGDRLYFASLCLTCAACAGWLLAQLGRTERIVLAALCAIAIGFVSFRLVSAYDRVGHEFTTRMALIRAAPKGSTVVVPSYSQTRDRYVLGDDFAFASVREGVARSYGLAAIELATSAQAESPLGEEP